MNHSINKLDLWNSASIIATDLKSCGVAKLTLSSDITEFETVLGASGKDEMGEHFSRSIITLPPNKFLWLKACDQVGKPIGFVAARYDDFEGWPLQRYIKEYWERAYKAKDGSPVKMAENSCAYAADIKSPVVYMGDGYIEKKWRGKGITSNLVRLLMLASWDEWKPEIIYGWMRSCHVRTGMHIKWGFTEAYESAFDFVAPPEAEYHRDAYFVSCRIAAIHQMIFSLIGPDRQAASNSTDKT